MTLCILYVVGYLRIRRTFCYPEDGDWFVRNIGDHPKFTRCYNPEDRNPNVESDLSPGFVR
jgi:hypothetical protein